MVKLNLNPEKIVSADDKFNERREAKVAAAEKHGNDIQMSGFPYDFGAPHGVLHLQLRNSDDKANWLSAKSKMQDAIAAGYGDAPGAAPLRTDENVTVMVSPNEGVAILGALSQWGENLFMASWVKKDAIRAATNDAQLDAIDVTEGWE